MLEKRFNKAAAVLVGALIAASYVYSVALFAGIA